MTEPLITSCVPRRIAASSRLLQAAALMIGVFAMPTASAQGSGFGRASFDCARARSFGEMMVCGDARLADKDRALADLEERLLAAGMDAMAAGQDRIRWLRQRDACDTARCVAAHYDRRLLVLRERLVERPALDVSIGDARRDALRAASAVTLQQLGGDPLRWDFIILRERGGIAYAQLELLQADGSRVDFSHPSWADAIAQGAAADAGGPSSLHDRAHLLLRRENDAWQVKEFALASSDATWKAWITRHAPPDGVVPESTETGEAARAVHTD